MANRTPWTCFWLLIWKVKMEIIPDLPAGMQGAWSCFELDFFKFAQHCSHNGSVISIEHWILWPFLPLFSQKMTQLKVGIPFFLPASSPYLLMMSKPSTKMQHPMVKATAKMTMMEMPLGITMPLPFWAWTAPPEDREAKFWTMFCFSENHVINCFHFFPDVIPVQFW